jgi:hypothetical protein
MGNVYKSVAQEVKAKEEYAVAKKLYIEKREAEARLKEINHQLRVLSDMAPEAVDQARIEVPFRRAHGRPKQVQIVKIPEFYENERAPGLVDTD